MSLCHYVILILMLKNNIKMELVPAGFEPALISERGHTDLKVLEPRALDHSAKVPALLFF